MGNLRYMHQSVLFNPDINEGTKTGKIGDNTRYDHTYGHIFNTIDIGIFKLLQAATRVQSRFA
ncbi:hypothetical protein D3C80_1278830 [compost metagenome]